MPARDPQHAICAWCGWKEPTETAICPQCGRSVDGSERSELPPRKRARTFSLQTLLLGITLICAWLAVSVRLPWGHGVLLGLLAAPAFFRTMARKRSMQADRFEWRMIDAIGAFFLSLALMWLFAVIGLALFAILTLLLTIAVTLAIPGVVSGIWLAVALSAAAALFVVVKLVRVTWPD